MEEDQSTGKAFFTTLPGIITAIAGLITAIGGFILILNKTGCISSRADKTEQHVSVDETIDSTNNKTAIKNLSVTKGNISYTPDSIKHLTRYLVYKITEATTETLPNGEVVLNVKLKCRNNSDYEYHFYSTFIGVRINGDNYGPDPYSPSKGYEWVPAKGFRDLEYNFKLPRGIKDFDLALSDVDTQIGSSAFTLK